MVPSWLHELRMIILNGKISKGKDVIGGRPGGVPAMALEYALKQNKINPKTDVNMVTNIDFAATAGIFAQYIKERLFFSTKQFNLSKFCF